MFITDEELIEEFMSGSNDDDEEDVPKLVMFGYLSKR